MSWSIRPAQPSDASDLKQLIELIFGDTPSIAVVNAALTDLEHYAHVAISDGHLVGFVSGFITRAADGQRRWELDLIGVHPDYRGRGIASALVQATTAEALRLGVGYVRALVATHNSAMGAVLKRHQYQTDALARVLCVLGDMGVHTTEDLSLVVVKTLTYCGVWLEGVIPAQLEQYLFPQGGRILGAVVSEVDSEILLRCGFSPVGRYHWWIFNAGNAPQKIS